jgi:hypothetical protein
MSERSHLAPLREGAVATAARLNRIPQSIAVPMPLPGESLAGAIGSWISLSNDCAGGALALRKHAYGIPGSHTFADLAGAGAPSGEKLNVPLGREAAP